MNSSYKLRTYKPPLRLTGYRSVRWKQLLRKQGAGCIHQTLQETPQCGSFTHSVVHLYNDKFNVDKTYKFMSYCNHIYKENKIFFTCPKSKNAPNKKVSTSHFGRSAFFWCLSLYKYEDTQFIINIKSKRALSMIY